MAEKLRIKQVRSIIGRPARQKRTMEALGLRRINHTREVVATPQILGMIESVGVKDVLAKCKGSSNPHSVVKATINALLQMKDPYMVAQLRGISLDKVFNG